MTAYPKVTLFVPTLNEYESMKVIMPQIDRSLLEQILIVDGKSKDNTVEYAKEIGCDVYIQKQPGLNAAYREAWPLIKGDYVITFSPDGNALPEDIPKLINKIREGYDMVIGSRYHDGLKSEDDDIISGFGNWLFTKVMNTLYSWDYTDAMTIFRIYRKDLFNELNLDDPKTYAIYDRMFFTKTGIEPILSARFAKEKFKGTSIPSFEPARIAGQRKLQIVRWGLAYMSQIIVERFRPRITKRQ